MRFANSVRFKVKNGKGSEFEKLIAKLPQLEGRLFTRVIKTGETTYCIFSEWESEEALIAGRPEMIRHLDSVRHLLEEISPELGVTDPVSGPVVVSK